MGTFINVKENNMPKVFIVDDDEFLLDMYAVKFRESGFEVEVARGAEEALKKIKSGYIPHVMLLDIVMPGMDGFKMLRTMGKEDLFKTIAVIVLSNLGQKEDIERGIQLGAKDYIVKAYFTPTEVVKKVGALLGAKA